MAAKWSWMYSLLNHDSKVVAPRRLHFVCSCVRARYANILGNGVINQCLVILWMWNDDAASYPAPFPQKFDLVVCVGAGFRYHRVDDVFELFIIHRFQYLTNVVYYVSAFIEYGFVYLET